MRRSTSWGCIGILSTSSGFSCCPCCTCWGLIPENVLAFDGVARVMSQRVLAVRIYVVVLVLLTALTVLTLGVSIVPMAGHWHIAAGLAIAFAKASLVLLFFMHAIA